MTTSTSRTFRAWVLPTAFILIVAACWWKIQSPTVNVFASGVSTNRKAAPAFALYDQNSRLFKLDAYLHRHQITVVFFDASTGAANDPNIRDLLAARDILMRQRIITIGISTALPQQNRGSVGDEFPFTLLTDVDPASPTSPIRLWGCIDQTAATNPPRVRPALFFIDRAGTVAWDGQSPQPLPDVATILRRI
jgi:peroxiredoxin